MTTKDSDTVDKEQAQPPLIPLSLEEQQLLGKKLAEKIRELADLERDAAKDRKASKKTRDGLSREIAAIASTIRQQGR